MAELSTRKVPFPWGPSFVALAILVSAYMVFFVAPLYFNPDTVNEMGVSGKIFYFHVGSAFSWYLCVLGCALGSIAYLVTRGRPAFRYFSVRADRIAGSMGEVGVVLGALILVTGPIWAKPNWGAYWTGEPRLMLALFLEFVLIGYVVLRAYGKGDDTGKRLSAGVAIIGLPAAYFIHYAVKIFGGNHPSVIGEGGGGWEGADIWGTAAVVWTSMMFLAILFTVLRYRHHRLNDRIEGLFLDISEMEDTSK
jgi:heme exporter protein C